MTNAQDADDAIVRRLQKIAREAPELMQSARIYEAILPLLRDADLKAAPVLVSPEQARENLEQGIPLLCAHELDLDLDSARNLMLNMATRLERLNMNDQPRTFHLPWQRMPQKEPGAAERIRVALEENSLEVWPLLTHVAAGEQVPVAMTAQRLELDDKLLWTLAENTLKPALRVWSAQLASLAAGVPWNNGACYVCGAQATLAELQDNNQSKHLRCGACGADWEFPRLQCMYCRNEDHTGLRYLYSDKDNERLRLEVCDRCHGYLKVISSFAPTDPEMLVVEDLASLHLDYLARERGYSRVSVQ